MSEIGTAVAALAAGELQEAELRQHIDPLFSRVLREAGGQYATNTRNHWCVNREVLSIHLYLVQANGVAVLLSALMKASLRSLEPIDRCE